MSYLPNISQRNSSDVDVFTLKGSFSAPGDPIRRTILNLSGSRTRSSNANSTAFAELECQLDVSPMVVCDTPIEPDGAILSGRMRLNINLASTAVLARLDMRLMAETAFQKPFFVDCSECAQQILEVGRWSVIEGAVMVFRESSYFPFDYHLPENLPQTTHSTLGSIDYYIEAMGVFATGETVKVKQPIQINRASNPRRDRIVKRLFLPTALASEIIIPSIIYAQGKASVSLQLNGLDTEYKSHKWRMHKVTWRLEEKVTFPSLACKRHRVRGRKDDKTVLHENTRVLNSGEINRGWKSRSTGSNQNDIPDEVALNFEFGVPEAAQTWCSSLKSATGVLILHTLVIDISVREAPISHLEDQNRKKSQNGVRVLRVSLDIKIADTRKADVSEDEEPPPIYDAQGCPPDYYDETEYIGSSTGSDSEPESP
jgi:hypothetical protein